MIGWLFSLFQHSIMIEISGGNIDRFLNLCKNNQLVLHNIKISENGAVASLSYKKWEEAKTYAQKSHVKCKIIREKGFVPFMKKYRKHVTFFVCVIAFFALMVYLSRFVWHIEVDGESVYTEEEIVKYVNENLVPIGTKRSDIRMAKLEEELRVQYDKVAWITCELDGTRLVIHLVETVAKDEIQKSESPCNIVAFKDGLVTEMIATSGCKVASPGDEVKKGDILITGVVNIYNEYEELIETTYVAADGVVYGQTKYDYDESFPMEYTCKKQGKKKKTGINICLGNQVYSFFEPKQSDAYEKISNTHTFHIGSSYYLPLCLVVDRYYTPEYETKTYTEEEAIAKQEKMLQNYIDSLKKKGVEILENNVTIETKDDCCHAYGTLVVKEIIGLPENFTVQENKVNENEEE